MTTPTRDPEIMIGVDGAFRRVPLVAIAATLRHNHHALRDALSKLFFALSDRSAPSFSFAEGAPTEGESGPDGYGSDGCGSVPNGSSETVPEVQKENGSVPHRTVPTETTEPSVAPAYATKPPLSAVMLAELLDDAESLPFYETVVATVAPSHIDHALEVTLARRDQLRGKPGGYFTAVIRRLTHSSPYARTPSAAP